MPVHIGTSGWQYRDWKGAFYPSRLPQRLWLEHYAQAFATVEVNATFYRLPKPDAVDSWRRATPEDFVAALKVSRYLTHVRRLRDPADPVYRFLGVARRLGRKLGPLLLQLPPNLEADPEGLDATLDAFGRTVRVAVEPRHESWFTRDTYAVLREHRAALCLVDRRGPQSPLVRTADWGYVRFHEGRASPSPCYGSHALAAWAERLRELWSPRNDLFVYFNNDTRACAVRDAIVFAGACRRVGLRPKRVPEVAEVTVR